MTEIKEQLELKDIPEFNGLYAATADGRIYSYRRKRFMKICNGNKGYKQVCIQVGQKAYMRYVHRLVAMAWIPNPDNLPEVNHIDENKANNAISNLEWCTRKYNLRVSSVGFKVKPVHCVELNKDFDSLTDAAKFVGVTVSAVGEAANGRTQTSGGYHWQYI
jgi:hypothetical protein